MFGKKKKETKDAESQEKEVEVQIMPEIFYGGKEPSIYGLQSDNKKEKKDVKKKPEKKKVQLELPKSSPVEKRKFHERPQQKQNAPIGLKQSFVSEHKGVVIGIIILFLVGVSVIIWYYVFSVPSNVVQEPTPPKITQEIIEEPIVEPEIIEEIIQEPIEEPLSLGPQSIKFPESVLSDSDDLDVDFLTDLEEEVFNTDSGVWDTDNDGYYDGQEVVNLYNPTGFAPVRLIDSGLIREYINQNWLYRLYYPISWEVASVDLENNQVLISDISGDYIEVQVVKKLRENESFASWFAREAKTEIFTDYKQTINRFKHNIYRREDGLVGFIDGKNEVYVLLYQPNDNSLVAFRHVMEMVLQSFRSSEQKTVLPEQIPVPIAPSLSNLELKNKIISTENISPEKITTEETITEETTNTEENIIENTENTEFIL